MATRFDPMSFSSAMDSSPAARCGPMLAAQRTRPAVAKCNKFRRQPFECTALPQGTDQVQRPSSRSSEIPGRSRNELPAEASNASSIKLPLWDILPSRQRLTLACGASLALSNMDKVNLTLAILPMAQEMGWNPTTTGLIQSSFFYGFLLMQIPGGALSSKMGGRNVLPTGVSVWSAATFMVPLLYTSFLPFCASRVLMGLGEAVAPSAVVDILAKSVPKEERASAIATSFGGLHVGSIIGLLACPPIINTFGWQAVFYLFGGAGLLWYGMFQGLISSLEREEPEAAARLSAPIPSSPSTTSSSSPASSSASSSSSSSIPYRAMLRSRPLQVLAATHFAHNWFHYTMLAWLPTYFVNALEVDLMHAAQTSLLPPIAGVVASAAAGTLADKLISNGVPTATVRKLAQCTAFLVPSALLLAACNTPCTPEDNFTVVSLITAALGISSFSLAGLYCTHQDLSPKYASTLLGMTNVAASIPGIFGVASVGALYEATHSWELSLFAPSALFMLLGAGLFTVAGSHDQIDFDTADNTPFVFEARLNPARRMWRSSTLKAKVVAKSLRNTLGLNPEAQELTGDEQAASSTARGRAPILAPILDKIRR